MFSFDSTPIMFVGLLVLFGWCTAWTGYELTRPQSRRQRISNLLHLAMSLVMLLMVAGPTWSALTGLIPIAALAGLFVLAAGWFAWLAVDAGRAGGRDGLAHFAGHAAMFVAMAWHLAAMAAMAAGMSGGHDSPASGHDHGGMEMGDWMAVQSQPGGALWWFALLGLPLMAYLVGTSLRSLWLAVRSSPAMTEVAEAAHEDGRASHAVPSGHAHSCHEVRPQGSAKYRLSALSDFAMTGGMFWMSTGLLTPILPVATLLAG
ncbi:MAG: DUF5134 domain-containing protein [Propionibacteriaceae bacterium]|nr:DUF5134 domain-containing protein [Propionibacteriaceae bacterium]